MLNRRHLINYLCVLTCAVTALPSPFVPPDSGYGSWGTHNVSKDSVPHPGWEGRSVYLFSPADVDGPVPVMIFLHGINATKPHTYKTLIDFVVSKGYAIMYPSFESAKAFTRPERAYDQMWKGIQAGMKTWGPKLDTAKAGFLGHSYGGGSVPAHAWKSILEKGWGTEAAFLFIMAPWYSYRISTEQLKRFPKHAKIILQVYEDDNVNDHRMARDLFENFGVPNEEKDFTILYSESGPNYSLVADHATPDGELKFGPRVNALDYYGIYRLIDALADYAFNGSLKGKNIALGNGSPEQRYMGKWEDGHEVKRMYAGDRPPMRHPQIFYMNFFNNRLNPRAVHQVGELTNEDDAQVDRDMTFRNYMKAPWYRKRLKLMEAEDANTKNEKDDEKPGIQDPECYVPQPDSGFGANGRLKPIERLFPHPGKGDANVHIIVPDSIDSLMPVVLFAPALWKPSTHFYRALIDHLVSRGNVVAFSTYNFSRFFNNKLRYHVLIQGLDAAMELASDQIDTTRVAFVGHSYGAGALPALALEYVKERGWGSKGACLFVMAPYFVFNTPPEKFREFPQDIKMIVQVYGGDRRMDWRIAEDIFYNLPIHPSEKDFYIISDAVLSTEEDAAFCEIDADHDAPQSEDVDETNVIDFYGVFRPLDALMEYAFTGSAKAKKIALGGGSKEQTFMGHWPDGSEVKAMKVTDRPTCPHDEKAFMFKWSDNMNERRKFYRPND